MLDKTYDRRRTGHAPEMLVPSAPSDPRAARDPPVPGSQTLGGRPRPVTRCGCRASDPGLFVRQNASGVPTLAIPTVLRARRRFRRSALGAEREMLLDPLSARLRIWIAVPTRCH